MSIHPNLRSLIIVVMMFSLFAVVGCHRDSAGSAAAESVLTDAKLVDQNGKTVTIDAKYVEDHLGNLVKDEDLSRYIL